VEREFDAARLAPGVAGALMGCSPTGPIGGKPPRPPPATLRVLSHLRLDRARQGTPSLTVEAAGHHRAYQHVRPLISAGAEVSMKRGGVQRGSVPLCRGSRGVPLILQDTPWVGGWEQPRPCYGENADATHRAQRSPSDTVRRIADREGRHRWGARRPTRVLGHRRVCATRGSRATGGPARETRW